MPLKNELLKNVRQRKYLAKDFDSFRAQLLEYAKTYYPDRIKDFSENSIGGLFLDFAAYVGDVNSFYIDHQYNELDPESAVEISNIEKMLRQAGVSIQGAAPAFVEVQFYIQVPAQSVGASVVPSTEALPIIKNNTVLISDSGVIFYLLEDVDFTTVDDDGNLVAEQKIGRTNSANQVTTFILTKTGLCMSGNVVTDTFDVGNTFVPFRRLTLSNPNVTEIISVTDSLGNTYYEVKSLTHDVVYQNVDNTESDRNEVKESIKVLPAPYRFITEVNLNNRYTVLTFGGGNADTLEDDIIPDPSEFAISFPYKKTFSRIPINPEKLLATKTLGVAATNVTLTITYRYGGGLGHNVSANSIRAIQTLDMFFPNNPSVTVATFVRSTLEVNNTKKAYDGADAPTVDELKEHISEARNAQERIVSRPDLISRIYTLPSNFGRVYRAAVRSNPNNAQSTQLFILSKDSEGHLTYCSDSLKNNLRKYLNPYRMINDAIDILDGQIINFDITFEIVVDPRLNKNTVLQQIITRLKKFFDIKYINIDQPLILSEIKYSINSIAGVLSMNDIKITNLSGIINNREYSSTTWDIETYTKKGILFPPPGGIFELKYPNINVIGRAV
jgi:hypothetical protein